MTIKKTYSEKLKDPRWQKKRLEILNRDNFTCVCCKDKETELQVHHLSYLGNPWDIDESNLITLCKHCHFFYEKIRHINFKINTAAPVFKAYKNKDDFFLVLCVLDGNCNNEETFVLFDYTNSIINYLIISKKTLKLIMPTIDYIIGL